MRISSALTVLCLCLAALRPMWAQVENVPIAHPVYAFLKRMETKKLIAGYHDGILPLSRGEVAGFLKDLEGHETELTGVEQASLRDFQVEFAYEIDPARVSSYSLLSFEDASLTEAVSNTFGEEQKSLYVYRDSAATLYLDGLLTIDWRRSAGDALGRANASFVQFGGRIRGTVWRKVGYFLQGTNAQFWGSRDVLRRDPQIRQAYTLGILNAQNFDLVEGYVRYADGILSAQAGRERILWGSGYGDRMIMSDNVRVFDFIRADVAYKSLRYSFLHGWLLGTRSMLPFKLPTDTATTLYEPVVADKYVAAHRLEASIGNSADIAFQEMAIYSNRSVDLAYLNPVTLIESAQRSREERDNILWSMDAQVRPFAHVEAEACIIFDDINFPKWGTRSWENKYAYQVGLLLVDPLVSNADIAVEYTRVQPYTFSHGRSRDNNYGSLGSVLSHHIGPNADSWFFRAGMQPTHRMSVQVGAEFQRSGENTYDAGGQLTRNVGGDVLQPHRETDPDEISFLDGERVRTMILRATATYEFINQFYFELRYQRTRRFEEATNSTTLDDDFGVALRVDF